MRGRTITSYHTLQDDVRNAGDTWLNRDMVEDGNWVTSRQPDDLPAFNRAMIGLFSRSRRARITNDLITNESYNLIPPTLRVPAGKEPLVIRCRAGDGQPVDR
jgi:hypothetical protein